MLPKESRVLTAFSRIQVHSWERHYSQARVFVLTIGVTEWDGAAGVHLMVYSAFELVQTNQLRDVAHQNTKLSSLPVMSANTMVGCHLLNLLCVCDISAWTSLMSKLRAVRCIFTAFQKALHPTIISWKPICPRKLRQKMLCRWTVSWKSPPGHGVHADATGVLSRSVSMFFLWCKPAVEGHSSFTVHT